MSTYGKHLISTQDWHMDELLQVLNLASEMKLSRFDKKWKSFLESKTFVMIFYNTSLRTRISFEAALTELGGHAQFITPSMLRLRSDNEAGESIKDAARVMSRYAEGIGIRIAESALPFYGAGDRFIKEYAQWATVPVINMANDLNHPCQGLSDILGWSEAFAGKSDRFSIENLKNKTLLLTWGHGGMARTWSSIREPLFLASRLGMNITIARPDGYDLDNDLYDTLKQNCAKRNTKFYITNDPVESYEGAHVVYSRNWMSAQAYENNQFQKDKEIADAMEKTEWITSSSKMKKTDNAIFTHCMPIDRGCEVTDDVADSDRSVIYDVAENRLHIQKAILALTMCEQFAGC